MKTFALTRKALADLHNIATYTERHWGRDQRYIYIKQMDDAFHLLAESPNSGKGCDHIKTGYRKYPQGSHIIFYKAGVETTVEIVRILHKHMDPDLHLQGH